MKRFLPKTSFLTLLLLSIAMLAILISCRSRTKSVLEGVLGTEINLVTVQESAKKEGVGFGDSAYAYWLMAEDGFTLLSKARKSQFKDDLEFAKANIEALFKRTLPEEDSTELFRTHTDDGWKIYALTGTNKNKIYLLVLTM